MQNAITIIGNDGKRYIAVESLMQILDSRRDEAYWISGEQFRSKLIAQLEKLQQSDLMKSSAVG